MFERFVMVSACAAKLILASASPRRRDLLGALGAAFEVEPAPLDELRHKPDPLTPIFWVVALAYFKACAVADRRPGHWVLGADTIVTCGGRLLGKPRDRDDARRMLEWQAAEPSAVLTGVALVRRGPAAAERLLLADSTRIWMHDRPDLRERYLAGDEWRGKAGAYGIQDVGDELVARREGSFSNVVGLPVERVEPLLSRLGLLAR